VITHPLHFVADLRPRYYFFLAAFFLGAAFFAFFIAIAFNPPSLRAE
jgi:hypothetical protein